MLTKLIPIIATAFLSHLRTMVWFIWSTLWNQSACIGDINIFQLNVSVDWISVKQQWYIYSSSFWLPPATGPSGSPLIMHLHYIFTTTVHGQFAFSYQTLRTLLNTLRPRQDGRHFADDILKCIFLNENVWIPIEISLKFVPKGPIDNIPALV